MEERKKSNVCVYVITFILIISIIGNVFMFITYNNKNTDYNDLKETYDKLVKGNKEETKEDKTSNDETIDYTSKLNYVKAISYHNNLYIIESYKYIDECLSELKNNNNLTFEGNVHRCNVEAGEVADIINTNIDSSKITGVYIEHDQKASDNSYVVFVLMNDGTVKRINRIDNNIIVVSVFEDYSIGSIDKYYCGKYVSDVDIPYCSSVNVDVTLINGTKKTIIEK